MQKQERQAEVEPLQEQATQMITQLEEEEKSLTHAHIEHATMIHEEITMQLVEAVTGKAVQVQERGRELLDKFHILVEVFQGACIVYVAWDEPHVSVGDLLGEGLV
jgi:hypothetical protein